MTDKLIIDLPIVVEGKYDKIKLDSILDARIITTEGFGFFSSEEKKRFLSELSKKTKIIVLTDSDGAGRVIRNHIKSILPPDRIINLYIPDVVGKEKRKKAPSKAGTLGVEGINADILRGLFVPYVRDSAESTGNGGITKADLYADGFLGGAESSEKRVELGKKLALPRELSSSAFLDALNMLCTYEEYKELLK